MKMIMLLLILLSLCGCSFQTDRKATPGQDQELNREQNQDQNQDQNQGQNQGKDQGQDQGQDQGKDQGQDQGQDQDKDEDQDQVLNQDENQVQEQELNQDNDWKQNRQQIQDNNARGLADNEKILQAFLMLPTGEYLSQDTLKAGIIIDNPTDNKAELLIELKLISHDGEEVYSSTRSCRILNNSYLEQELSFTPLTLTQSGSYLISMIVWNGVPGTKSAYILKERSSEQGIVFYQKQENFDVIDAGIWEVSEKRLGRSRFKPEHVSVAHGILTIRMPAGKLEGGELTSKEQFGYGAYEARMKLPEVSSSITGFFLYEAPDYYYEIDIELYNTSNSQLMLTTYAEGKVQNQYTTNLDFDPTEDFHDYRIEYRRDRLEFYVDNEYVIGWPEGIPDGTMRIMINSWYPKWLDGIAAKEDQALLVDWLRY